MNIFGIFRKREDDLFIDPTPILRGRDLSAFFKPSPFDRLPSKLIGGQNLLFRNSLEEMFSSLEGKDEFSQQLFSEIKEHIDQHLWEFEKVRSPSEQMFNSLLGKFLVVSESVEPRLAVKPKKLAAEAKPKPEVLVVRPMKVEDLNNENVEPTAFRGRDGKIFLSKAHVKVGHSQNQTEQKTVKTPAQSVPIPKIVIEEPTGGYSNVPEAAVHLVDSNVFKNVTQDVIAFIKLAIATSKTSQKMEREKTERHTLKYIKPENYHPKVKSEKSPLEKTLSQESLEETRKQETRLVDNNLYYTMQKVRRNVTYS